MTSKQEKLFLQTFASAIETACVRHLGDCAGYCTFICALSAYALRLRGLQVAVIAGRYAGEYHWWLEVNEHWRLDPSRSQFDRGPLLEETAKPSRHQVLARYPDDWTGPEAATAFESFFSGRTDEAALNVWQTIFPEADQEFITDLLVRWCPTIGLFNEILAASLASGQNGIETIEEMLRDKLDAIKAEQRLLGSARAALAG